MAESSEWIMDTTTDTFEADVMQRSQEVPIVVDFWAPWCEPCRQLAPLLDKLAIEADGKFLLVKVNIEEHEQIAASIGVQSIPLVLAFRDGQVVNQFMGILPEEELREWLATFLPTAAQELVVAGQALEPDDLAAAETKYREAMALEPDDAAIKILLASAVLAQGREDEPQQMIAELEKRGFLEPEAERIKAQLELQSAAEEAGGVDEARKAVEVAPDDLPRQVKLADALAVSHKHEEALEICLRLIQQDKTGTGVEAKETMLKIFELLGNESELVSAYRRKMATALY